MTAWADTRTMITDIVLIVLGAAGLAHEFFIAAAERPIVVGAAMSCLGKPLVAGMRR